ncbi:TIGR01777 family oxidoreductase [Noviherbaspirillum saxi]|nr:TIGR01777 family oxidoreductase [Noviherbaspirillum saxi]
MPPIHFNDRRESVLVTGATGFIGQTLVRALLADGQQVTVLSRDPRRAGRLFEGRVKCIGGMAELPADFKVDVIVNLAGARILGWRWSAARRKVLLDSRLGVTRKLVDWIARAEKKPRLMFSASAIGYYGIQKQGDDTGLTEDSPPQPIFMSQLCQAWETEAQRASDYGVTVLRMRFGLVLGKGGALPMMMLPIRLGLGGPLGGGRQWLSWIHVDDLIRGIAHLWNTSDALTAAYNFAAPGAVTQREFSKTAARILRRPSLIPTPAWPMRLILGEQADLLLEGQRVVPDGLQNAKFGFLYPDVQSALKSLY